MTAPTGLTVPFLPGQTEGTGVSTPIVPPALGDPAPTLTVEVGFGSDADNPSPEWTDLSALTKLGGVAPVLSGSTSRGRSSERDTIQAGSATVVLDNPDADFTPANADGAYAPDVKVDKQVRKTITPPPPYDLYAAKIFRGFVTSWAADIQGGFESAETTVAATDNSDGLSLVTLKSDFATEVANSTPYGYWPMGEGDTAESIGDASGNGRRTLPVKTYIGLTDVEGAFKFGDDALVPSDATTALLLQPIIIGGTPPAIDSGHYVEFSSLLANRPTFSYSQGFAVGMAFKTSAATGSAMVLLEMNDTDGNNLVQVYLSGSPTPSTPDPTYDYKITSFVFPDAVNPGAFSTSAKSYNDGKPHLLVVCLLNDGRTLHTYVDGVRVGTAFCPTSGLGTVVDGRVTVGVGTGITSSGGAWYGTLGHLAAWEHQLTAATVTRLWQAWSGFPGERADDRIRRYLGYATWPAGTVFDQGVSVLGLQMIDGLNVLDAINQATASEQGLFFIAADGTARFHNRHHRWNKPSLVTFSGAEDSVMTVDRSGLVFTEDRQNIANDVTGTRPGGTTQRATDATSIREHRRRTQDLQLAVLTDDELFSAVSYYVYRYAQPDVRVGSVVLDPYTKPALWRWALSLEIGDRITLDDLPATAPATMMDFFVESVAHDYSRTHFKTTLQLSPATRVSYWQVGVPGHSEVGLTTLVGY